MNEQNTKPNVAPPAGYKPPSLPALAALGAISAAALAGCERIYPLAGAMIMPVDEQKQPQPLSGEALPLEDEHQPVPLLGFAPEAE